MSSTLQPIKLWGKSGPNPPKVAIILAELGLPYTTIDWAISDVKAPSYLALNPNGRLPTIHDPNTGLTLWESGAIIDYLVTTYDASSHALSFAPGSPEAWHAKQWLAFQISGQGPYFGQAVWFKKFHAEQLPSAKERYFAEAKRITGVLDGVLKKSKEDGGVSGEPWLVGGRISYADLAFVPWFAILPLIGAKEDFDVSEFEAVQEWLERMNGRETVKKVFADVFKH